MNGQMVRDIRTLLARRQPTLVYLIAMAVAGVAVDLLVAEAGDRFTTFSDFSRREFDEDILWRGFAALGHGSPLAWVVVLLAVPVSAVLSGWLEACYLIALGEGRYSWKAPRRMIAGLSLYSLVLELLYLAFAGLTDNGQALITVILLLASSPPTLYTAYAIAFDDVSLVEGTRRSLRMFRVRPRESVLALIVVLLVSLLAGAAFANGFDDSSHVQPTYLGAWELVNALLVFVTDVVLLTLYRGTRLELSAGGSDGSRSASPPPGSPG